MIIQILDQPIFKVDCDVVALHLFSDMRPPKGATGTVDWYLNGFISKLIKQGKIKAGLQDMIMMATQNRIGAPKVLLLGMGSRMDLQVDKIFSVWKQAAEAMCSTGVHHVATSIPFDEDWDWEVRDTTNRMLKGLIEGIKESGKNIREFKLYLTNFNDLKTKENKEQAHLCLKSIKQVNLIGY